MRAGLTMLTVWSAGYKQRGSRIPVGASGFHAGMHLLTPLMLEPLVQGFTSVGSVAKVVGTDSAFGEQMPIEGAFGQISAKG